MIPGSVARFAAPVACIATALVQLACARGGSLNPAKGGGFGLFSTVDKLENRVVFLSAIRRPEDPGRPLLTPGYCRECEPEARHANGKKLSRHEKRLLDDAASFPREAALARVARAFAARRRGRDFHGIRVEVWARTYDRNTQTAGRVRIAEMTLDASDTR